MRRPLHLGTLAVAALCALGLPESGVAAGLSRSAKGAAPSKAAPPARTAAATRAPSKSTPAKPTPAPATPASPGASGAPATASGTTGKGGAGQPKGPPTPPPPAKGSPPAATPDTGAGLTTTPVALLTEVSGWIHTPDGGLRGAVPVAFWPKAAGWSTAEGAVTVQSARRSGRYTIHLPDGAWMGTACGSPTGHAPLFWEVVIDGQRVVSYRERDDRTPAINRATIFPPGANRPPRPGDTVRIDGSGLGCSGHVSLYQAGQEVARVERFTLRTDGRLTFTLPAAGWDPDIPLAFAYTHGRWRSDLVAPAAPPTRLRGEKR